MKNYVVQTLCQVTGNNKNSRLDKVPQDMSKKWETYQAVQNESYSSIKHFLEGDWEYVLLSEPCEHMFDVFKQNFTKIHKLWTEQECNILFCGLDVQFIKPTKIFGEFDKFLMFNYSDPKTTANFEHNFNCDIRYYPSTMSKKWMDWTVNEAMHNLKIWDDEQDIHNYIMWDQDISIEEAVRPHLAWQGMGISDFTDLQMMENHQYWNNGVPIIDAHIIHWHTSRGAENRLEIMSAINEYNRVPVNHE